MEPRETQLTQASVSTKGIIRFTTIPVSGDKRGIEAQAGSCTMPRFSRRRRGKVKTGSPQAAFLDIRAGRRTWNLPPGWTVARLADLWGLI
jgi:hypothetical protein